MTTEERTLFTTLLQQSELFDVKAKQSILQALAVDILPEGNAQQLLLTLKMEQNLMAIIDQRAKIL